MKGKEDTAWGITTVSEVINVVLTRGYPQALQVTAKQKSRSKVWVMSNIQFREVSSVKHGVS